MEKRLIRWEAAGFLFVAAAGTVLHFAYDWSGGSTLVGAFSAVNESTWEHMKIFFFPAFVFSVAQLWFLGRTYPDFLASRTVSLLTGTALIPMLFYTYIGALGRSVGWVNIAIFYAADAAAFLLDFRLLRRGRPAALWPQLLGLTALWALAFCFVWCTFHPVELPLWRDPVTGLFGMG